MNAKFTLRVEPFARGTNGVCLVFLVPSRPEATYSFCFAMALTYTQNLSFILFLAPVLPFLSFFALSLVFRHVACLWKAGILCILQEHNSFDNFICARHGLHGSSTLHKHKKGCQGSSVSFLQHRTDSEY